MNEFLGSEHPFEIVPIEEVTPVVEQANRALRTNEETTKYKLDLPNVTGRMDWTSLSNDRMEFYDITTGITPAGGNFLQVGKQVRTLSPHNFTQTVFYLETGSGAFMATHEDFGDMNINEVEDATNSRSDDLENLMYDLGEYKPQAGDWAECQRIITLGETHAKRMAELKKAEEEAARPDTVANAAREILLRAFSED